MSVDPIGHGGLGLRSGLRSFDELTEQSYCERRAYADVSLGKQVGFTGWSPSGNAWFTTFNEVFEGVPLEVLAIAVSTGENLIRVETIAEAQATVGNYYFLPGLTSTLYIHLLNNVDPNTVQVRADFLKRFGGVGAMEPLLGPNKSTNPGLETWTAPGTLGSFTNDNIGATGVSLLAIPAISEGTLAARVAPGSSGLSSATHGGSEERSQTWVSGAHYAVEFTYRTHPQLDPGLSPRVRVKVASGGTAYLALDGRNTTTDTHGHALALTGGEVRRCLFVFRAPSDSTTGTVAFLLYNTSGAALSAGYFDVDDWSIRRIYRYEYVEPRLAPGAVPAIELSTESIFPGDQAVGLGSMQLLNSDDLYFETLLSGYDVVNRMVYWRHGGGFDNGQEITFGDTFAGYAGRIQDFDVDDLSASFSLQNTRAMMALTLPLRHFSRGDNPNMADADVGRARSPLFGTKTGIRPTRVDYNATTFLPIYEVADPTDKAGDVMTVSALYVYLADDDSARKDSTRRIPLSGSYWTQDAATGRVSLTNNPGPIVIEGAAALAGAAGEGVSGMNDGIDFDVGGGPLSLFVPPGIYTAPELATAINTLLAPSGITVTYSATLHKYTFAVGVGLVSLLIDTGVNKHRSILATLGFNGTVDVAGPSVSSTVAVYDVTKADQFIVRVDATGMRDDAGGSYTGTPAALIEKGPDIYRFMLLKMLKRPSAEIDSASFAAARTTATQRLGIYFDQDLTVQDVQDGIEISCNADLVMDGAGKTYWRDRPTSSDAVATAAVTAPIFYDRDFLAFSSGKAPEDTYSIVRLTYDRNPDTGQEKSFEVSNPYVELRHGRPQALELHTWLLSEADVIAQCWNNMLLAVLPRRRITFTVKGRLLRKLVTDLVRSQRTRTLTAEIQGMANADVFRLVRLNIDPQNHITSGVAYTADLPRVGFPSERAVTGNPRTWKPAPWFVPAMAGVISPYRPGRLGP